MFDSAKNEFSPLRCPPVPISCTVNGSLVQGGYNFNDALFTRLRRLPITPPGVVASPAGWLGFGCGPATRRGDYEKIRKEKNGNV